ncbi:PHB depolymerase family esterase [Glaesserella sp.]|uniref:PHB depolymerase family esterase n=1 Tax=Glaesserella sp. TaxID=2094731 RepID=UPI0035A000B8
MKTAILLSTFTLAIAAYAQQINFNLKAQVFDYGQNIVAIELETKDLKLNEDELNKKLFKVRAKGQLPIDVRQNKVVGVFDTQRNIEQISLTENGNILLTLESGKDIIGANTLAYASGDINRNLLLNLDYQLVLQHPISNLPQDSEFQQQKTVDHEVDLFSPKVSKQQIQYQFYQPQNAEGKRPLIIWLHGNGEGGYADYQNNRSQILANRGAVTFVTPQTQQIFGGAYVIAPQAPDTWYNNYSKGYIQKMKSLIDEVVAEHAIDPERIYLFGASAGGYMALRMLIEYPNLFAAANVSAPALDRAVVAGGQPTTAEDLQKIKHKPLWLVHAANDPTISYSATSKRVFEELRDSGAILTVYPEVKIDDQEYNGHWSWIYSLRNMPFNPQGDSLFQWMAKQKLGN